MIEDMFTSKDERAGATISDWLSTFRSNLKEAVNQTVERTLSSLGRKFWKEMKENAELSSCTSDGAIVLAAQNALSSFSRSTDLEKSLKNWEIHVVGHSAGSIFASYAIPVMLSMNLNIKTVQFFAPAITMDLFSKTLWPLIDAKKCPTPLLYILNDDAEREDTVQRIYGHSLLYLVSNAFEDEREMPLLGMEKFLKKYNYGSPVFNDIAAKFSPESENCAHVIVAGDERCASRTHGGFDNDPATMNTMMKTILDVKELKGEKFEFNEHDLEF